MISSLNQLFREDFNFRDITGVRKYLNSFGKWPGPYLFRG
jgi:hypothetical protein